MAESRKFKDAAPVAASPTPAADPNEKYRILFFTTGGEDGRYQTSVYLLNPGDFFVGFGASRHGLKVTKTASLVVRQRGPWGLRDTEYDLADKEAWRCVFCGFTYEAVKALAAAKDEITSRFSIPGMEARSQATVGRIDSVLDELKPYHDQGDPSGAEGDSPAG